LARGSSSASPRLSSARRPRVPAPAAPSLGVPGCPASRGRKRRPVPVPPGPLQRRDPERPGGPGRAVDDAKKTTTTAERPRPRDPAPPEGKPRSACWRLGHPAWGEEDTAFREWQPRRGQPSSFLGCTCGVLGAQEGVPRASRRPLDSSLWPSEVTVKRPSESPGLIQARARAAL
jgi:hypothetical protein